MNLNKAAQLQEDLQTFLTKTTEAVSVFNKRIMSLQQESEPKPEPKVNGIVLDHKIFSDVVNALSCAVNAGDAGSQATYDKLLAIGKAQSPIPARPACPPDPAPSANTPKSQMFEVKLPKELLARIKEQEQQCASASEMSKEEEKFNNEIEAMLAKQFPGLKVINAPEQLFELLLLQALANKK